MRWNTTDSVACYKRQQCESVSGVSGLEALRAAPDSSVTEKQEWQKAD